MLPGLPYYIPSVFNIVVVVTAVYVVNATKNNGYITANKLTFAIIFWLILQAVLTLADVYDSDTAAVPPKILLFGIFPAILMIIALFATTKGRGFIDNLPLKKLILLHSVRIPVELVLYWLSLNMAVPELMTFKGYNFDIIAGLTAPIVYYGFVKKNLNNTILLIWNVCCLALLITVVLLAVLSAPSPLQRFAFDQPNVAILNFPFSWLPTFIVPIVLFSHLVAIRKLLIKRNKG